MTSPIEAALRTADRILANEKIEGDYILDDDMITLAAAVRELRQQLEISQKDIAWQKAVNKSLMDSQESLARDLIACRESKK